MKNTPHNGVRRPRTEGPALVLTREPRATYRAHVTIAAGLIHAAGVELRRGAYDATWYEPAPDRVWTRQKVREVRWLEDRVEA